VTLSRCAQRLRPRARGRPACRRHDVDAVPLPAREPPALDRLDEAPAGRAVASSASVASTGSRSTPTRAATSGIVRVGMGRSPRSKMTAAGNDGSPSDCPFLYVMPTRSRLRLSAPNSNVHSPLPGAPPRQLLETARRNVRSHWSASARLPPGGGTGAAQTIWSFASENFVAILGGSRRNGEKRPSPPSVGPTSGMREHRLVGR
jgi:hypothetical protein